MKKVIIIVNKDTTISEIDRIKDFALDPKKPVLVATEELIKKIYNVDFDDAEILTEK